MKVTEKEVRYIAGLARLHLEETEVKAMSSHMSRILGYIEKLNTVDTSAAKATFHAMEKINAFRDDETHTSLANDDVLKNGPKTDDGFFVVPKVVTT